MLPHDKLSKYFTYGELTATNQGTPNDPDPGSLSNLRELGRVLDYIQDRVGKIAVTSAFRSYATQAALKGGSSASAKYAATKSYHMRGMAADVVPLSRNLDEFYRLLFAMPDIKSKLGQISRISDRGIVHIALPDPPSFPEGTPMEARDDGRYYRLNEKEIQEELSQVPAIVTGISVAVLAALFGGVYFYMKNKQGD